MYKVRRHNIFFTNITFALQKKIYNRYF